jgi:hypothetical protein
VVAAEAVVVAAAVAVAKSKLRSLKEDAAGVTRRLLLIGRGDGSNPSGTANSPPHKAAHK